MTPFRVMAVIVGLCVALGLVPVLRSPPTPSLSSERSQLSAIVLLVSAVVFGVFLFANMYFKIFSFLQ